MLMISYQHCIGKGLVASDNKPLLELMLTMIYVSMGVTKLQCVKLSAATVMSAMWNRILYYSDVIMGTVASQITKLTIVYSIVLHYIHYKVWDEITYPFLNFNGATVEV